MALLCFFFFYNLVMACSGEGASQEIYENKRFAEFALLISVVLAALIIFLQLRSKLYSYIVNPFSILFLLVIHPFWWLGVYSGDCGKALFQYSLYLLMLLGAILLLTTFFYLKRKRSSS